MPFVKRKDPNSMEMRFMPRNKACRKLQLTLGEFRRVCIIKGIYPQVPPKKFAGDTSYFLRKDIVHLFHDPIIPKIREIAAQLKRIKRMKARANVLEAKLLQAQMPIISLDHVVLERYPTFKDALSDFDDALCLLFMFSRLSSEHAPQKIIDNCKRLCREWDAFVAATGCLVRSFVSTKGYYYQAVIQGVKITWLVPHRFQLEVPDVVDFKVLKSFVEFYQTFAGFVLYRLYSVLLSGYQYPPAVQEEADYILRLVGNIRAHATANSVDLALIYGPDGCDEPCDKDGGVRNLNPASVKPFIGQKHAISREVPREPLELVLLSGGADVFTYSSSPHGATHIIVDRPPHNIEGVVGARIEGCAYLQPQWCFDSLNWGTALPHAEYAPGAVLPPHVSPFYDDSADADGYVPDRVRELDRLVREKDNMVDITTLSVAAVKGLQEHGLLEAKDNVGDVRVSSIDALAMQLARAHATSLNEELDLGNDEQEASESDSSEINPDDFYRKNTRTLDAEKLSEETRMRRAMLNATKARIYDRMVKENEEVAKRRQELERRRDELRRTIELEKAKVAMGVDLRTPAPPDEGEDQ